MSVIVVMIAQAIVWIDGAAQCRSLWATGSETQFFTSEQGLCHHLHHRVITSMAGNQQQQRLGWRIVA